MKLYSFNFSPMLTSKFSFGVLRFLCVQSSTWSTLGLVHRCKGGAFGSRWMWRAFGSRWMWRHWPVRGGSLKFRVKPCNDLDLLRSCKSGKLWLRGRFTRLCPNERSGASFGATDCTIPLLCSVASVTLVGNRECGVDTASGLPRGASDAGGMMSTRSLGS